MPEVEIGKFAAHYHLPQSLLGERRRLDSLVPFVLDEALESALERAGLTESSEVCVREISALVKLDLGEIDTALASAWSEALAHRIGDEIKRGESSNVVSYYSRRQALFDMAISLARGSCSRAWAWRQLGLWTATGMTDDRRAIHELVSALSTEPAAIVPILTTLARFGLLENLIRRLEGGHWETLALAVLSAARAGNLLTEDAVTPTPTAVRNALRITRSSAILRAAMLSRSVAGARASVRRAAAALAAYEAEPALLRTGPARSSIEILAGAIASSYIEAAETRFEPEDGASSAEAQPMPQCSEPSERENYEAEIEHQGEPAIVETSGPGGCDSRLDKPEKTGVAGRSPCGESARLDPASPISGGTRRTFADEDSVVREGEEQNATGRAPRDDAFIEQVMERQTNVAEESIADLRQGGFTEFGGLLFLINLIEEMELADEIPGDVVLGARSFRWTMHRLAMALVPIEESDAAALAFVGLAPDAESPASRQEPITEAEESAIQELAGRVVDRLWVLLDRTEDSAAELLDFICRRRAQIVADPGWIEVTLSIDQVSTRIRKVGLDLDPGWVAWLGVILRFVYE